MSEIEPGEGWRLLRFAEQLKAGDEIERKSGWCSIPATMIGDRASPLLNFRRRIPSKPEPMEIDHQNIRCNSFDEVMQCDDSGEVWRLVSNAEQARQLADWLNRYADWRESQNL